VIRMDCPRRIEGGEQAPLECMTYAHNKKRLFACRLGQKRLKRLANIRLSNKNGFALSCKAVFLKRRKT
jgi:hypothetical protein